MKHIAETLVAVGDGWYLEHWTEEVPHLCMCVLP